MKTKHEGLTVLPYPRTRLLMADGGRMGLKKHTVHGLVEFDITQAREAIRQHKTGHGRSLILLGVLLGLPGKSNRSGQANARLSELAQPVDHL